MLYLNMSMLKRASFLRHTVFAQLQIFRRVDVGKNAGVVGPDLHQTGLVAHQQAACACITLEVQ